MDVHEERRFISDRRAGLPTDGRRGADPHALSEDERIEAAQFMLGTRQREEAVLRATHLHRDGSHVDEERARETLAQMLRLQEDITTRTQQAQHGSRRQRRHSGGTVIDLDTKAMTSRSGGSPLRTLLAVFVLALLTAVGVVAAVELQLI